MPTWYSQLFIKPNYYSGLYLQASDWATFCKWDICLSTTLLNMDQIKWCKYTSIAYKLYGIICQNFDVNKTNKDQTLSSDMVTCGNKIVREYIFSTKQRSHNDEDEKDCQPACTRWSFDLRQITVTWSCDYLTVITYH